MAFAAAAFCQARTLQRDVVYLWDGSIIKGTVVEHNPHGTIKIQMSDGSVFTCMMDDVRSIDKETYHEALYQLSDPIYGVPQRDDLSANSARYWKNGYRGFVEVGGTLGVGDNRWDRYEFSTTHGIQVCPNFFAGVGFGVHYFDDDFSPAWLVPLYADLRCDLVDTVCAPYLDLRVGYSVGDENGFYLNPSFGIRFWLVENWGMSISVGYELQRMNYEGYRYSGGFNSGGFNMRMGFDF